MASDSAAVRERARLAELASYRILDGGPEAAFDAIAHAASLVAQVPVAAVGLIDATRAWFKAAVGTTVTQVPRELTFCDHIVRDGLPLVVEDAATDPRFAAHPIVLAPGGLRFYAGFPLTSQTGAVLGTLCVSDISAHTLTSEQVQVLWTLADQVMAQLELRRQAREASEGRDRAQQREVLLDAVLDSVDVGIQVCDADGMLVADNAYGRALLQVAVADVPDLPFDMFVARVPMADRDGRLLTPDERPLRRTMAEGIVDTEVVLHPRSADPRRIRVRGRALRTNDGRLIGGMIASHDVTADREREAQLSDRISEVERLADASRKILSGQDASAVACEAVLALCDAQQVSVLLPDDAGHLVVAATTEPALAEVVVPLDVDSLVGRVYRNREPLLVDPHADTVAYGEAVRIIEARHGPVRGAIYQPLLHENGCNGVLLFTTGRPLDPDSSRILGLLDVVTAELSTSLERDRLRRRLAAQAATDPLTGLANRRTWDERLGATAADPVCLAILDLDHFKLFNDAYGHQAGDALLVEVAAGWRGEIRAGDLLARLGGEEFGLLLPACSLPDARALVAALRTRTPHGQTASAGVAQRRPGESVTGWYGRADRALYQAKGDGRDRICADDAPFVERRGA